MQKRHLVSIFGSVVATLTLCTPLIAGNVSPANGGPSKCGGAEGQGGGGGDGGKDNSDPIYLASGDFQHVQSDLFIPGRGLDFEIKRHYRSRTGFYADATRHADWVWRSLRADPIDAPVVGINWDFNYNMRISIEHTPDAVEPSPPFLVQPTGPILTPINYNKPENIYVFMGNGRADLFNKNGGATGAEDPSTGQSSSIYDNEMYGMVLHFTGPGYRAQLIDGDMTVYSFYAHHDHQGNYFEYGGRLASITDKNGNQIAFQYETSNGIERIAYATDTLGHLINFQYHDDVGSPISDPSLGYLLWKVEDHAGRVVQYEYTDTSGVGSGSAGLTNFTKLSKVTLPSIDTDAANGFQLDYSDNGSLVDHGRFPNGRTWLYTYASHSTGLYNDGQITAITDPNGVNIIQNTYDENSTSLRSTHRVIRQQYGDDAYNYTVTDELGETDLPTQGWAGFDYYVWVNDRRGAVTRFKYSKYYANGGHRPYYHRQLLEKTEFIGFVTNPDQQVWAICDDDAAGTPISWHYFDTNGDMQTLASGPVTSAGATGMVTKRWDTNENWNPTTIYAPIDGDYTSITYDTTATDARRWGAMLSRTRYTNQSPPIEETWAYNFHESLGAGCGCGGSDDFATGYKDGNGNITIKEFDTAGNLIKIYHDIPSGSAGITIDSDPNTPGSTVASAASAIEAFTYNQWGQIETHTHPKKDTFGTSDTTRVDKYVYFSDQNDAANYGRLKEKTVDFGGENLTTKFEYDLIGNMIKRTHPDDDVAEYVYNQQFELAIERHEDDNNVLFAQTDYFYDANGNLVRKEIKNLIGDPPSVDSNDRLSRIYTYDDLGFQLSSSREHGDYSDSYPDAATEVPGSRKSIAPSDNHLEFVTSKNVYDGNRNLKEVIHGEAVNGSDTANIIKNEYDYRDLLIKRTTGYGDPKEHVVSTSFDEKGRIESVTIDPGGNTQSEHYEAIYDGFDRIKRVTDPMGNERHWVYDNNSNVIELYFCGPLDEDTSGGTDSGDTLARQTSTYDARDRLLSKSIDVFDYDYVVGTGETCGDVPASSTQQVTEYIYNNDSSIRKIKRQSGVAGILGVTDYFYDTASRLSVVVGDDGSNISNTYDLGSNLTNVTHTDFSTISGTPLEVFVTDFDYDALHRRVSRTDGAGNLSTIKYDSRGNAVELTDARGNVTINTFDGLNRLTATSTKMTDTGDGSGVLLSGDESEILTTRVYDDSNRLVSEKDDNNEVTSYEYDGLNRVVKTTMPDSEEYTTSYDHAGNAEEFTDARGVIVTQQFDLNNRLISRVISGTSVSGVTEEVFSYDGLGRLREAINKAGMDELTKVVREYDSRSNVTREIQNVEGPGFASVSDRIAQYEFDEANNTSQIVYPSGRVINRGYDELNRLVSITDPQMALPVTVFDYINHGIQRRTNGNNTQTDYAYNGYTGYNGGPSTTDLGFGRVASISTTNTTTTVVLDAFDFAWDKSQNRTTYDDTGSGMVNRRERSFGYDSSNRLVSTDVDYPDPLTDFTSPTNGGITDYALDGVHNRIDVTGFEENGAEIGSYDINENNQYTASPLGGGADWVYLYDENGNMILQAQDSIGDFNDDYSFNQGDVSGFLAAYGNQETEADINGDGSFNFQDVSAFMADYTANQGIGLENRHYTYDYRNQLIRVSLKVGSALNSEITNRYDPLARRVVEELDADGDSVIDAEKQMVYGCTSFWEVIEQIDLLNDEVLSTHVFGIGIDDEVQYQRPNALAENDIWSHRDDLNSLTSITDDTGAVLERFEYGDYGLVKVLDASGGVIATGSDYGANHLYTGRLLLSGTELYDYRNRMMDSNLGRFMQIDPLGTWFDLLSRGNAYAYVGSAPVKHVDPFGFAAGPSGLTPFGWGTDMTYDIYMEQRNANGDGYWYYLFLGSDINPRFSDPDSTGPDIPASRGNCWRYACDDPAKPGESPGINPGGLPGSGLNSCDKLMSAVDSAGATEVPECGDCPEGSAKIAAFLNDGLDDRHGLPDGGGDYHFYRLNPGDGTWYHKRSTFGTVTNTDHFGTVITHPLNVDNRGYDFCGERCMPLGTDTD